MKHERFIDIPLVHGTALLRRSWLERLGGWAVRGWSEDLDLLLRCESVFRKRRGVNVIQAGAPTPPSLRGLIAPIILVFGSPHARARWREALVNLGSREDVEFIFIA
jgi:hypothetical protein